MKAITRYQGIGRLIPFLLLTFLLISCEDYSETQAKKIEERRQVPPKYRVITIEGCEYLRFEVTHGYAVLAHKGNCRNRIHCYQDTTRQVLNLR